MDSVGSSRTWHVALAQARDTQIDSFVMSQFFATYVIMGEISSTSRCLLQWLVGSLHQV